MKFFKMFFIVTIIGSLFVNLYGEETKNTLVSNQLSNGNKINNQGTDGKKVDGIIKSNWGSFFNITRLQTRITPDGRTTLVHAMFLRFPNKMFLTEGTENTLPYKNDPRIISTEIYIGGPVVLYKQNKKLFGWVTRLQAATEMKPQYSLGAQYNISDHESFKWIRDKSNFTTFLQVFPIKNDNVLGYYDILHYYSFTIYKKFYVRGYNRISVYHDKENYVLAFQDFILPVASFFDVYARQTYQNRNDVQYGEKGSEWAFGCRLNISI